MMKKPWGQSLFINLYGCDHSLITSRKKLGLYSELLCKEIGMTPFGKPLIKKFGKGNLKGYSLIQFIETSSITVHLDEFGNRAFIDIFSCKPFSVKKANEFTKNFFKAKGIRFKNFYRK